MTIRVKDTYLSEIRPGDRLIYRFRGLIPELDFLGALETALQGNGGTDRDPGATGFSEGDATHVAVVMRPPDPEAEVVGVRTDPDGRIIFKVIDSRTWEASEPRPGRWDNEVCFVKRKRSLAGIKFEATWPRCQQWVIDWENPWMEVWRPRRGRPEDFQVEAALFDLDLGEDPAVTAKQYDVAEFLTFGNIRLPNADICSEVASVRLCEASAAVNAMLKLDRAPIILTPDLRGILDPFITPTDTINSGEMYRVAFQGLK